MSEWITDRLPTFDEAIGYTVLKWHKGKPCAWAYDGIKLGEPWQPIPKPAPYVKPKRWTVEWNADGAYWVLTDGKWRLCMLMMDWDKKDAAQRICDIYNEAMP
jgi:hypothetical protein